MTLRNPLNQVFDSVSEVLDFFEQVADTVTDTAIMLVNNASVLVGHARVAWVYNASNEYLYVNYFANGASVSGQVTTTNKMIVRIDPWTGEFLRVPQGYNVCAIRDTARTGTVISTVFKYSGSK